MKIYTKTGDKGTTALVGGTRVSKNHIRVEAYGTVDELISHIGVVRSYDISKQIADDLHQIQICLMNLSAVLASDGSAKKIPQVEISNIDMLENRIDNISSELEPLKYFVLPGGQICAAQCHVARSVCRRAERVILSLHEEYPQPENLLKYVNRLSDYLFVLARKLHKDFGANEIFWIP